MITVFREEQSKQADAIEVQMHDMVVGFERVTLTPQTMADRFGKYITLPAIQDGYCMVSGKENLDTYLKELADFYHDWHMYQGDACYVYENGESC